MKPVDQEKWLPRPGAQRDPGPKGPKDDPDDDRKEHPEDEPDVGGGNPADPGVEQEEVYR